MLRLLFFAAIASLAVRALTGRWPWDFMRAKQTPSPAVSHARKLLAVREHASRGEILEAHRRLVATVHPDRGGSTEAVHEANAARDLLLDALPDGN